MAINEQQWQDRVQGARVLLLEGYGDRLHKKAGLLPAAEAVARVAVAARGADSLGNEGPSLGDVHASLTLLREARARLDDAELTLIQAARTRGDSWQPIADALGLATRQGAEARALRLERATRTAVGNRYVPEQRADRSRRRADQAVEQDRQRSVDAWAQENAARIAAVASAVLDTSAAWPAGAALDSDLQTLTTTLTTDAPTATLLDHLDTVRRRLRPVGAPAPEPVGARAADAQDARDARVALGRDEVQARWAVTPVRTETA